MYVSLFGSCTICLIHSIGHTTLPLQCVNAVAGALETAAHSHSRVQSSAADLETKSSSVLSEMAAYAALTCPDNATLAVAEDIAVQVRLS